MAIKHYVSLIGDENQAVYCDTCGGYIARYGGNSIEITDLLVALLKHRKDGCTLNAEVIL